jgi:hypothetical protein
MELQSAENRDYHPDYERKGTTGRLDCGPEYRQQNQRSEDPTRVGCTYHKTGKGIQPAPRGVADVNAEQYDQPAGNADPQWVERAELSGEPRRRNKQDTTGYQ